MHNANSTLIRSFLTGLFPLLMLTLLASCQKENPIVSKEPRIAARAVVGEYDKKPVQVRKPSATNITRNSARIEWRRARRAEDYIVLRRAIYADNPESGLSPADTTSGLSYDDTDLVPDTEYSYRIVARNNVGKAKRSSHLKFRTLPEPVGTVASAELVGPEEAEGSEEVAPEEAEGSEEVVPQEEEVSEEAVPEEEEESRESSAAETESAEEDDQYDRKPAQVRKPSATDITRNSARIEWRQSSRAEEYIVTRRALYADDPESSLSPVHTTSELSYDDTDLVPDTEFIYRIVARNNVGEAQRSSHLKFRTLPEPVGIVVSAELVEPEEPEGSEVEFIPEEEEEPLETAASHGGGGDCGPPGKVEHLHVENGFNADGDPIVRVEWDLAEDADMYRVDRLNTTDPYLTDPQGDGVKKATPETIAEVSTNTYEDGTIEPNTTYGYRIYPAHSCLTPQGAETVWARSKRSLSAFVATPDFQVSSPPTPGCPENRDIRGDKTEDYPGNITTCGNLTLTNEEAFGTLGSRGDHDWYRLDLEEGTYQFDVSMDAADGRLVILSGLYDYRGKPLPGWRNFSQNTGLYQMNTVARFTVKKGTYFINIHSENFSSGDYFLTLSKFTD